jgi:hypothetical protein
VIVFKRVADLGAIRLTVYVGFVIILAFDLFGLLHDYSWFGMYVRLGVGMFGWEDGFDWLEGIGVWIGYSDWIMPRLLTYAGMGYLLARRKGFPLGICISVLVALADSVLYWLMFLRGRGDFEAPPLWIVLQYVWPNVLRALLLEVSILGFIALTGAMLTLVRWPSRSLAKRRPHTVRRINPPSRPARGYSLSVRPISGHTGSDRS